MKSVAAAIILSVVCLVAASPALIAQAGKKEYTFKGKIEKVDAKTQKLTVNGEKVEGWMQAMTMDYKVDKAEVLKDLKVGDQITARVVDGDFMTLYDVKKQPPAANTEKK
jgi:protein SCO1/2